MGNTKMNEKQIKKILIMIIAMLLFWIIAENISVVTYFIGLILGTITSIYENK